MKTTIASPNKSRTRALRDGYVPLVDSAPLVMVQLEINRWRDRIQHEANPYETQTIKEPIGVTP